MGRSNWGCEHGKYTYNCLYPPIEVLTTYTYTVRNDSRNVYIHTDRQTMPYHTIPFHIIHYITLHYITLHYIT